MTLINEEYKKQLQEMHQSPKMFNSLEKRVTVIEDFLQKYKPTSLIDFGCGKGRLFNSVQEQYPEMYCAGYDPGVPEYEILPNRSFDCLVSTDALEHVEPEMIDETLKSVGNLFTKSAYLIIAGFPAKKTLPDGRNAHLIIESFAWWENKIKQNIDCKIVHTVDDPVFKQPKKGPPVEGRTYLFILEK